MPFLIERHAVLLQVVRSANIDCVDDIVEDIFQVMQGATEKASEEYGFPLPPYAVYNISGGTSVFFGTTSVHYRKNS